jgi:hypothetical protein
LLISGPKFADANYVTVLTPTKVLIYDNEDLTITISKEAVLQGWRDRPSGLWRMPLSKKGNPSNAKYLLLDKTSEDAIANVYELPSTSQVIKYLHASAGYPMKATWLKAIDSGSFLTWPHLTAKAVQKHFPQSDETTQGHLRSIKQGIRSTKTKKKPTELALADGQTFTIPLVKHQDIYVSIDETKETIYTDQTGAFPVTSHKGNRYVMILCEINNNVILSEPMRNRTLGKIVRAYQAFHTRLAIAGIRPKKHVLDNECSNEYKEAIRENGMTYEMVPKGQHR